MNESFLSAGGARFKGVTSSTPLLSLAAAAVSYSSSRATPFYAAVTSRFGNAAPYCEGSSWIVHEHSSRGFLALENCD
jgi:hypothetical protein